MNRRAWFVRLTGLFLVVLLPGCEHSFTYKLWQQDQFRHHREPATNAAVAVYYAPRQKDFLVAYNSLRDGDSAPRRQAYFLGANEALVRDHQKPKLTATNRLVLEAVPVNLDTDAVPRAQFHRELIISTEAGDIGPYALPVYVESTGTGTKAALTPLAVAGDITCLAFIAGFFAVLAYAHGGCHDCGH
jgi:hypothetical protein